MEGINYKKALGKIAKHLNQACRSRIDAGEPGAIESWHGNPEVVDLSDCREVAA